MNNTRSERVGEVMTTTTVRDCVGEQLLNISNYCYGFVFIVYLINLIGRGNLFLYIR